MFTLQVSKIDWIPITEHISSDTGQTVSEHVPSSTVVGFVQYVMFSLVVWSHVLIMTEIIGSKAF